jgi:hypothetical protein
VAGNNAIVCNQDLHTILVNVRSSTLA